MKKKMPIPTNGELVKMLSRNRNANLQERLPEGTCPICHQPHPNNAELDGYNKDGTPNAYTYV